MPSYLLKVNGKISGPHSDTKLQEMASVLAFDEAAELAPESTEDWKAIRDIPELHTRFFPPKKTITLKEKVIVTLPQENNEPITVDQILNDNLEMEARLPPKKVIRRPNRRRRDFLASVLMLDGAIAAAWYFLPRSQEIEIAAASAAVLMTLGLYWLFYQMMDRY
jgi:hypothetical protein